MVVPVPAVGWRPVVGRPRTGWYWLLRWYLLWGGARWLVGPGRVGTGCFGGTCCGVAPGGW